MSRLVPEVELCSLSPNVLGERCYYGNIHPAKGIGYEFPMGYRVEAFSIGGSLRLYLPVNWSMAVLTESGIEDDGRVIYRGKVLHDVRHHTGLVVCRGVEFSAVPLSFFDERFKEGSRFVLRCRGIEDE